jgi:Protein of unknown function (DUF4199)
MVLGIRSSSNGLPITAAGDRAMVKKVIFYGLLAGVIVGVPLFGLTVARQGEPPLPYGVALGYATMLIALSVVFIAIKQHRDRDLGGVIRFWPAFALGLGISVIAGVCYVLAWEAALSVTGLDFAADYAKMLIEQQRAQGVDGEALAKYIAEMEKFQAQYANPLYRMPMTFLEIFPVGVLVSAISAALLRKSQFMPAR